MSEHSKLSPSAAQRWLTCPGSLQFQGTDESEYAAEGTVAHALAHSCWLSGADPELFVGQPRHCDGHTIVIDGDMACYVQQYLDVIESRKGRVLLENRFVHQNIEDFGGTVDCLVIDDSIEVIDFKYGAGIPVDVDENLQLACYALLAIDCQGFEAQDVRLTVVQPRATHADGPVRSWVASKEFLVDLMTRILAVAMGDREGEFAAGDHCRWCPGRVDCQELYQLTLETVKADFEPESITPELAAEVLGKRTAINAYLKEVERWAHSQLDQGVEIPGYKLVEAFGNRRYSVDEAEIVRRCKNRKFGKKQIYKTELLSPAQLEKVVGKELVTSLVERPSKGTTLVPESDKRPAAVVSKVEDEFADCVTN
jgi:hypothetical protein